MLVAVALAMSLAVVVPVTPAEGTIGGVVVLDQFQDPTDYLETNDGIFVYVTADLLGGQVCIIPGGPLPPSAFSCDNPAWGKPLDVSAIGGVILPLQEPFLKVGTWRLLGDNLGPGSVASDEFIVGPCTSFCSTAIATQAFDDWKDSARGAIDFVGAVGDLCDGLSLIADLDEIKAPGAKLKDRTELSLVIPSIAPGVGYSMSMSIIGGAIGSKILSFTKISELPLNEGLAGRLLWVGKHATCRAHRMFERMVADPPDPNFDEVAEPAFFPTSDTPHDVVNDLQQALTEIRGYGDAQVTAVERYQGAVAVGDVGWQRHQAAATAENGYALVAGMRDAADAMRLYSAELDADPEFDVAATQEQVDLLSAEFQRITDDGFDAGEMAQLTAEGLDADEIDGIRAQMDPIFLDRAPVGVTIPDLLLDYADRYDEAAFGFDEFARIADDVAHNLDEPPVAAFEWIRSGPNEVTVTSTSVSPDGDPIAVTWDFGDGELGAGDVVVHQYDVAGTYQVTVTATEPGTKSSTTYEQVEALPSERPVASFLHDPMVIVAGEPSTFTSTAQDDGTVVDWTWSFGSAPATGESTAFTFPAAGPQLVEHTVTDDDGQLDQIQRFVEVNELPVDGRTGCDSLPPGMLDSVGREFLFGFPANWTGGELSVHVSGPPDAAGFVEVPGAGWSEDFTVPADGRTVVAVPSQFNSAGGAQLALNDSVGSMGVRVCADAEVAVYGLNQKPNSTDAFMALPTDVIGADYITASTAVDPLLLELGDAGSQLTIVGVQDDTTVTVTPTAAAAGHPAGVPFSIELHRYGTYLLEADGVGDLTGTHIEANHPISVLSGSRCAYVPVGQPACDHLVEQLMPTSTWGREFLAAGLAGRAEQIDLYRVIAREDDTVVTVDGVVAATIDAGAFHEFTSSSDAHHAIQTSTGAQVLQYATGNGDGDPFMTLVVPTEQLLDSYTVAALDGASLATFEHWENLVVPASAAASCEIDGAPTGVAPEAIGTSGYVALRAEVDGGTHHVQCDLPFSVTSYGWGSFESYGYPGGLALEATVPGPPIDVSAIGGDASANVRWEVPATDGGSPIIGYEIEVMPGGTTIDVGNVTSHVVTGLTNDVDHTFSVRAHNAYGFGPPGVSNVARPRASCATDAFVDVDEDHPFCPEITWMADNAIAAGWPDGTYRPGEAITRQAFTAFIYRVAGSPNGSNPTCASRPFSDVPIDNQFCGEIAWADAEGISTGFIDGTFRPGETISRMAMGAFLYRLSESPRGADPACTTDEFTDVSADHPFCGEIDWMVDSGLAAGSPDGRFLPAAAISRQAMAAFIFRYDVLTGMVTG